MLQEFIDDYLGIHDPDPSGNFDATELAEYARCAVERGALTTDERRALGDLLTEWLTSPRTDSDAIVVPTGQLYIEALPGSHPVLEDFKLMHRGVDLERARSELRKSELENLRYAARLFAEEHDDPDVERRVIVEGTGVDVDVNG